MFSLKKVDDLRAREREQEEKGTTNSAPKNHLIRFSYCTGFHGFGNQNTWQWTIKFDLKKRLLIGATSMYFWSVSLVYQLSSQFLIYSVDQFFFWSTKCFFDRPKKWGIDPTIGIPKRLTKSTWRPLGLKYIFLKNSIAMVWAFRGQNFLVKSLKMYLRLTYVLTFLQFLIQTAETCAYLNG